MHVVLLTPGDLRNSIVASELSVPPLTVPVSCPLLHPALSQLPFLLRLAQCQTSTQKLNDRYLVDFGFDGVIWATVTRAFSFNELHKNEAIFL